jgi:glycosyltransferase involved in cell wall biosynthesis
MNYSVLMSVYDKEKPEYLKQSIESMLNQTVKPEQFVVVEDGALNKSLSDIIDKYKADFNELFTIVKLQVNGGLGNALNQGLKACRNELVARMDSDDISLPRRCEKELKLFLDNPDLSIVGTNIDEFWDNPNEIKCSRIVPSSYEEIKKNIGRIQPFNHPTVMYKRSEVLKGGGYPTTRRNEDRKLFSVMIMNNCKAENINESLLLYRSDKNNYKRRKSWRNCIGCIKVSYSLWRKNLCRFSDFIYVLVGQIFLFILPLFLMKLVSDKLLRR